MNVNKTESYKGKKPKGVVGSPMPKSGTLGSDGGLGSQEPSLPSQQVSHFDNSYPACRQTGREPTTAQLDTLVDKLINEMIDSGSPTVDTLALMLNKEAREAIREGQKETRQGKGLPLKSILD